MRRFAAALAALAACAAGAAEPGSFLVVAKKDLRDPFFSESVVLVMNHPAPIGVILNKPRDAMLARLFPDNARLAAEREPVYFGGPVQPDTLVFLFRAGQAPKHPAVEMLPGIYYSSSGALLQELLARDKPLEGLRVFAGRAGWARNQLEAEVKRGGWHVLPAEARHVFHPAPRTLWRELESRATSTQALGVELDHVAVAQRMLGADVLSLEP